MPKLRCDAIKCRHNANRYCTRNAIEVGCINNQIDNHASCKNFKLGESYINNEFSMDLFLNSSFKENVSVCCDAKACVYNKEKRCCTHSILIDDDDLINNTAFCITYKTK